MDSHSIPLHLLIPFHAKVFSVCVHSHVCGTCKCLDRSLFSHTPQTCTFEKRTSHAAAISPSQISTRIWFWPCLAQGISILHKPMHVHLAHSLCDKFGTLLGHQPLMITRGIACYIRLAQPQLKLTPPPYPKSAVSSFSLIYRMSKV